ncbi:hypothetical protein [Halomarina ordinaria]|uniref:DUF7973 domain-containing protein n=1 Tax=Halomarina ordinaria TaxID=3033939 RepID=A0ABD5U4P1_9EURY|nr:hypothetical protein [Halomarina sp. PSRA2]
MVDISAFFTVELLIAALAGGAFGAALGALPAFIFTGFMVIAGEAAAYVDADAGAITGSIAFGPVFGPHISFAAGAAATAYAAKKGYIDDPGFDYHDAKDIGYALGTKPDVLAVGAVFGVVGYWITTLSSQLALPWDPIALGVTLSALVHRVAFGYGIIGDRRTGLLDMSPFESEERRVIGEPGTSDAGGEATDGGAATARFLVEPWLPHQYKWANVAAIGAVVGVLGAYIAFVTESAFLAFGISAASLVFLNLGVANIPVTHHMSLPASTAALAIVPEGTAVADGPVVAMLLVGALFGLVCALFGEVFQRVFYAHGDTHWDPPAAAIVFGTLIIGVLALLGVFPSAVWVPQPAF